MNCRLSDDEFASALCRSHLICCVVRRVDYNIAASTSMTLQKCAAILFHLLDDFFSLNVPTMRTLGLRGVIVG